MNMQFDEQTSEEIYDEREDPRIWGELDLERRIAHTKETRCLIPWKRCWDSEKSLFLKKCVKVTCSLSGPGDDIRTYYYFESKRWTIRLLKK
jgi:hypothetical protein